ncbi:DUF3107 family protein [Homoserinibacter sp. YIM 151385]|uniref:DUF3107 family protein n=1 Tax=Homoserinibacter sp. YIM 151385 TaxID=2985506 RepID=UPI0022F0360C|nr:DUF3107 family protein [Homoserinibacter sp. YIM 151385]WBU37593.1 DUF3107 family protein [Homoserinibacter sp. YIM 151385]
MADIYLRIANDVFTSDAPSVEELKRKVDAALDGDDPWLDLTDAHGQRASVRMCSGVPLWIESREV